jgi:hypothetical protein
MFQNEMRDDKSAASRINVGGGNLISCFQLSSDGLYLGIILLYKWYCYVIMAQNDAGAIIQS